MLDSNMTQRKRHENQELKYSSIKIPLEMRTRLSRIRINILCAILSRHG